MPAFDSFNPALVFGGVLLAGMMVYFIVEQQPPAPKALTCTVSNVKISALDSVKQVFRVTWDGPDRAVASTTSRFGEQVYFSDVAPDQPRTILIPANTNYFIPGLTYLIDVQCQNDPDGVSSSGKLIMPPSPTPPPPPPPPINLQCRISNATISAYRADVQNWVVRWFGADNVTVSMQQPKPRVFPLAVGIPNTCFIPLTPDMQPGSYPVTLSGCNKSVSATVTLVVPYRCLLKNVWLSAFDALNKRWVVTWDSTPDAVVTVDGTIYKNDSTSTMRAYIPWNPQWAPGSSHQVVVTCAQDTNLKRVIWLTTPAAAAPLPIQPKQKPIPINPPQPAPTPACAMPDSVKFSSFNTVSKQWLLTWTSGVVTNLMFYNVSAPSVPVLSMKPDDPTGKHTITLESLSSLPAGTYNVNLMCLARVATVQLTKGNPPPSPTAFFLKNGGTLNGQTVYYFDGVYNFDASTLQQTRIIQINAWSDKSKTRSIEVKGTKYQVLNGRNFIRVFVDLGDFNTGEIATIMVNSWVECVLSNDWGTTTFEGY